MHLKEGSGNTAPVTANALHEAAALAQPDMTEEEIRDLLDVTEKGQVKSSIPSPIPTSIPSTGSSICTAMDACHKGGSLKQEQPVNGEQKV